MENRSQGLDGIKRRSHRLFILIIAFAMIFVMALTYTSVHVQGDDGFSIVETYPEDGADNAAIENLGIKITFSTPITEKSANRAANDDCFTITGPNGELDIKVYYNPKDDHQILVLYDVTKGGSLTSKSSETFTVKISGALTDDAGNTLGEDKTITFSTINQAKSTRIYLVMMLLMMAGMGVYTTIQTRKKMAEEEAASGKVREEAFNPYKEAKRTGKPVAEVIAEHEKEVAKKEALAEKEAKKKARFYEQVEEEEEQENFNYKVKGPRPISAVGGKYKPPKREAEPEAPAKKSKKKK